MYWIIYQYIISITSERCFALSFSLCPFILVCLPLMTCSDGHFSVWFLIVFAVWVPELFSLAANPKPSTRCSAAFLSTVLSLLWGSASHLQLPLGLGAPSFALSLSGVAGPFHSGSVCCPGLSLGSWMHGCGELGHPSPWMSSWSSFPDTWTWFLRYYCLWWGGCSGALGSLSSLLGTPKVPSSYVLLDMYLFII